MTRGIFDALQESRQARPTSNPESRQTRLKSRTTVLPAPEILATALDISRNDQGDLSQVAHSFAELAADLDWWSRYRLGDDPTTFTDGHASIVGAGGLEDRDDVEIGVSLLAPNVQYPDHHHPPAEVYLAMTPGVWRKNGGPWIEPGIGGTVFNESNTVHAMKSDAAPLFAFWCLLMT